MVRRKEAQAAALLYVAVIIILCFFNFPAESTGIYKGCGFWNRIAYPFVHSSFIHALLNVWCLLSIIFLYPVSIWTLIGAFIISASFPVDSLSFLYDSITPTVGASGVCYALIGRITFLVKRKLYFTAWIIGYIAIGFLFPVCNAWLHLYCYLCGLGVGLLNMPIIRKQ